MTLIDRGQTALVQEALDALALHLGGIDVALGVDSDVVEVLELARPATDASEVSDDCPVAAADDVDLPIGIIGGEPVGLSLVGPEYGRPGDARTGRVTQHRIFRARKCRPSGTPECGCCRGRRRPRDRHW